jgi:hypothetical protein
MTHDSPSDTVKRKAVPEQQLRKTKSFLSSLKAKAV